MLRVIPVQYGDWVIGGEGGLTDLSVRAADCTAWGSGWEHILYLQWYLA